MASQDDGRAGQNPDRKTSKSRKKTRVHILGCDFGGLNVALEFEKRRDPYCESLEHALEAAPQSIHEHKSLMTP